MSSRSSTARGATGPSDGELLSLGKLHFLAGFCPLHQRLSALALTRIFHPAVNNGCVRFFENDQGRTAAALIWARLSGDVSERLLRERVPPSESEWAGGNTLWFVDLLAPFGHGRTVARHIARNPPDEPFYFARLDGTGQVRKVVCGDATVARGRVSAWPGHPAAVR